MGFSFHNTIALEGLWVKSEFVRIKLNIEELKDKWKQNTYLSQTISKNIIIEGILILYFIFAMYSAFF
jgi:hypothetical protein